MKTKYIHIILFLLLSVGTLSGQNTMASPVDLGSRSSSFSYTDTKNTSSYTNNYTGRSTNDVFYKFTITVPMDVIISHCGSAVTDTYVYLLNASGTQIAYNDDYSGEGKCSTTTQSYLKMTNLAAGTYYVVSEGYSQNGNITTAIQGTVQKVEYDLGSKSGSFTYTHTQNTASCGNSYQGQSSNDVFYKFTTTTAMDVIISHCGSAVSDTYVHLLDASGARIAYNDDYSGEGKCSTTTQSYLKMMGLAAGTYYVVSEGYSQNGNITTAIQGIVPIVGMGVGSTNRNYIHTRTYTNESGTTYLDQVQYFDGLGRPVQTVQKGITPDAKDLVSLQEYDAFGRESNTWLPGKVTAANNGAFVALETAKGYIKASNGSDQKPYSLPVYEASPLNRVLKQFGPGQDWHNADNGNGKAVQTAYKTNSTTDATLNCKLYIAGGTNQAPTLTQNGNYATGQLYVTEVKDEDGNTGYEFKDKLGQVVLTRQVCDGQNYDTYYVYNDFGLQCFVLPPRIQEEGITQAKLNELAYLYKYDNRNRCISKKIPGCEWNYYVYDKADRLIFSQDGEQYNKSPKEWTFTIPDAFGRVVLTGTCTNSLDYSANPLGNIVVKATYNTGRTNPANSYTVTGVTSSAATILSVNFYDGYEFLGITGVPNTADTQYTTETGYGVCYGDHQAANKHKNKGLLTGTLTAQMNADGTTGTTYLYSVMYYDNRARLIQAKSNNHLTGGIEKEYIAYNFTGQPTQRKHVHQATGKDTQTEVYTYTYDHAGRLYDTKHKLNSQPETCLLQNRYDEQGRLARQGIGQQAAAPKSQSAPAGGIMKMSAAAPMAMMPSPDIPVPDGPGTPVKSLEYMGSLGANGTLTYSTFLYDNRISTPDLQFTLRQSGWVTIEYPLLPALGLTVTTFLTYSNGVCHDMAFVNEEDLSTPSVSKIRYYIGAGTHIFNIYNPVVTGVKGVPATITLTASGSTGGGGIDLPELPEHPGGDTGGGGNNNPEPLDPVNFTVTPAQVVEYAYNVRSWTKSINSPLFVENLDYTYNGNIKWMDWKQDNQTRKYTYTYDNLSRLKTAAYTGIGSEQYGTSYSYDKHGNIKTLQRYGKTTASAYGLVDNLTMTYTGNQLTKVTDAIANFALAESADFKNYGGTAGAYTYNKNGAMATDSHKGILGIKYNSLNLPQELLIKNTEVSGKVYYTYSASGVKLKTKHMKAQNLGYTPVTGTAGDTNLDMAKTTDYVGNKVYEDGALKRVLVDGGYIEGGVYHYYLTDHLGNNRAIANASGTVIQKNHYYPFGTALAEGTTAEQGKQPYKYNGKELDQMHGLNLYDYSARYYESAIGRFTTVDPLAEQGYSWSPYAYCFNNPIKYIDPNGQWPFPSWETIKKVGQIIRDVAVEAAETRVTVGLQVSGKVELSNVKVGAEVNLISTDVAGISNGEPFYIGGGNSTKADVEFLKQGFEIGAGLIGFSMSDTGIQKGESKQLVNEEKVSLTITPFTIENTKTKPINSNGEQIAPTTEKTEIKAGDIGFSISAIIGLEVKLDLNKAWEVLGRHLNN